MPPKKKLTREEIERRLKAKYGENALDKKKKKRKKKRRGGGIRETRRVR